MTTNNNTKVYVLFRYEQYSQEGSLLTASTRFPDLQTHVSLEGLEVIKVFVNGTPVPLTPEEDEIHKAWYVGLPGSREAIAAANREIMEAWRSR